MLLQLAEHQKRAHDTETEEAQGKGCRGFFRTIKRDEMPYKRCQNKPRIERMPLRLEQWGAIWWLELKPLQLPSLEELKLAGIQEAI